MLNWKIPMRKFVKIGADNISKNDEIQNEVNQPIKCISVENKLFKIVVEDKQENLIEEDYGHQNQLEDDELEIRKIDNAKNLQPASETQDKKKRKAMSNSKKKQIKTVPWIQKNYENFKSTFQGQLSDPL